MGPSLRFEVHGVPAPQGSKKYVGRAKSTGRAILVEMSKKVKPWRQLVAAAAVGAAKEQGWVAPDGPIGLIVEFHMRRPADHYGTGRNADRLKEWAPSSHTSTPDLSKLVRSTEDALVTAGVIVDDRRISELVATKVYCDRGAPTGAFIVITSLVPDPA